MITIGCTGGLGSGKSTVAGLLATRGAFVIDADALARAALEPRAAGYEGVIDRFGAAVVLPDGSIDRAALAAIVFVDPAARRDLEAIVHPIVVAEVLAQVEQRRATADVVVLDLPLLVETGGRTRYGLDGVLVVDVPEDVAISRLVAGRQMDPDQARARLRAQVDPATRLKAADFIIMNHGSLSELEEMVVLAWEWIGRLATERGAPIEPL